MLSIFNYLSCLLVGLQNIVYSSKKVSMLDRPTCAGLNMPIMPYDLFILNCNIRPQALRVTFMVQYAQSHVCMSWCLFFLAYVEICQWVFPEPVIWPRNRSFREWGCPGVSGILFSQCMYLYVCMFWNNVFQSISNKKQSHTKKLSVKCEYPMHVNSKQKLEMTVETERITVSNHPTVKIFNDGRT